MSAVLTSNNRMDVTEKADVLVFYVNGKKISEPTPDPKATLLQYLRRKLLLPGTKEGCGHGGCGSCTVMVSKYDVIKQCVIHYAVNACLFPLCAAHGLAITTVEGVGSPKTGLHQVQKRLMESHGIQCGFCTPGFVMSMFTLLRNNPEPSRDDVEAALEGNLCRCTGYRPILDAFSSFTQEGCGLEKECCRNKAVENHVKDESASKVFSTSLVEESTQVPIFPSALHLPNDFHSKFVHFSDGNMTWYRPTTTAGLVSLKDKFPDAPIIMGNTTLAQYLSQGHFSRLIYSSGIADLKAVETTEEGINFGAAITMTELKEHLGKLCYTIDEFKRRHFPSLLSMVNRYGADQVRNVATLGGSLRSGRSNSDVTVLLTALNASATVASVNGERTSPIEDLVLQNNEVITTILIPYTQRGDLVEFFKQTDRRTFSLAILNSGMYLRLDGNNVKAFRLCFGGFGRRTVLAQKTSKQAENRVWDEALLHEVIPLLTEELSLEQNMKDEVYKTSVAIAFIYKFYTAVRNTLMSSEIEHDLLEDLPMPACTSSQFYHPCTDEGQPDIDPLGRPVPILSSEDIVSGKAMFIDDIPKMQGELFLSFVVSSRPHAKILHIDASKALEMEGVHSFVNHTDIPGRNLFGPRIQDEEFFASDEVVNVGQPIGAILAETREVAHRAAKLVKVDYEDLEAILTIEEAIKAGSYLGDPVKMSKGDVEKGLAESAHVVEGELGTGYQEHFYMETHGTLVVPRDNNELEVFCASQYMTDVQESVSKMLKIPKSKITVRSKRVGGAFGGKEPRTNVIVGPAALAAHTTGRPVRCILPRETDMLIIGKRHPTLTKYKVGFDDDGHIQAVDINLYCNGGSSMDLSFLFLEFAALNIEGCYSVPNLRFRGNMCRTNTLSNTPMRGFGRPQAALVHEHIVFHIATELGMPQEKVRETNLIQEGHMTSWGQQLRDVTVHELWRSCWESSKFETKRGDVDSFNRTHKWKKRGLAMTTVQFGPGLGKMVFNQGAALVNIYTDGSVLVSTGGVEFGQGLYTKLMQVAARELGIPLTKVHTTETSSSVVPNAMMTAGSIGTDFYAPAVMDACNTLNERLKHIKEKYRNATWEELIDRAFHERVQLSATGFYRPDMDVDFNFENKVGKPYRYNTFGVVCSEVEIDVLTGENQVLQSDIIFDVGKSLNPAIDIGQIEGAFVMGLGMMTSECTDIDGNGRMMHLSPLSYKIPNVRSIPRKLNVTLLKNHNVKTDVYSSKGIGEPPLLGSVSVLMAIDDAVQAARAQIGLRGYFRLDSPATVQRIREACGNQLPDLHRTAY